MSANVDVLAVMDRARDVLAETYAKYQTKIGPFASQSQKANGELRDARAAVAELIAAARDVNDWLIRINLGGTAHQRHLAEKLARVTGGQ